MILLLHHSVIFFVRRHHHHQVDRLRFAKAVRIPLFTKADAKDKNQVELQRRRKTVRHRSPTIDEIRNVDIELSRSIALDQDGLATKSEMGRDSESRRSRKKSVRSSRKIQRPSWVVLFHPSLLAMVKFVGFANVDLSEENQESAIYRRDSTRQQLYFHHALAVEIIEEWWSAIKSGKELRELARLKAMRNFRINQQKSNEGRKAKFKRELTRINTKAKSVGTMA